MRIVVDINHPGHVHFFKNFIREMEKHDNQVLITATEKDISFKLLNNLGFQYINLGSYGVTKTQKLINLPIIDLRMYLAVRKFKPDLFVGLGSIRAAHVSYLFRNKCVNFEDTEHSREQIKLYLPFVDVVCTPSCFKSDLGNKQVRYNGYHELAYLHPTYFSPNPEILNELGLVEDDTFIIVRFVSWGASHDVGQHGILDKLKLVRELEKYGRVLITSEGRLPKELERYKIKVSPEKLHDLLYYATLYVGEGGTTASEAATLGTHAIHISTTAKHCGLFDHLRNYGLMWTFDDECNVLDLSSDLLQNDNLWELGKEKRNNLIAENLNVTDFMVWFVENYPSSLEIIKENPEMIGDNF